MKSLKLGEVVEEEESVSEPEDAAYDQDDVGDDDIDVDVDVDDEEGDEDEEGIAWDAGVERETEERYVLAFAGNFSGLRVFA